MVNYIRRIFNYLKPTKYMNMSRENQNRHKHDSKNRETIRKISEFFYESPLVEEDLDFNRDKSGVREDIVL